MTAIQLALGLARLAGIVFPAFISAHLLRRRCLSVAGATGTLVEIVLALSILLIVAEALGLVGLMRPAALIPALLLLTLILWRFSHPAVVRLRAGPAEHPLAQSPRDATRAATFAAVVIVVAQWCVQTANALGAGMFNFDTLWYHMPFAAHIAQSGTITGVQFTQADPYVAYYPANSELFHAIGIATLHNDFLSPLLNLLWLALALLAAWCLGRPWRVQRLTLIAGCLVTALPVLSGTQPGEAFNDIVGLAMLLAGAALAVNAAGDRRVLAVAGLALGVAVGTKFTFIVPAFALVAGIALCAKRGSRRSALCALSISLALTAGWWYLRNLIAVGNPLGLKMHLGPFTLPGPSSPLESASQQTVISELSHLSLWTSRFAPGLDHALGPMWPLVLMLYVAAVASGIVLVRDPMVRVLAFAAAITGISYLFLPTGASAIAQGSMLFEVNLRYATPAFALGIMLVPAVLRLRAPRALVILGPALILVLAATQLESSLWPTQTVRHLVFLAIAAGLALVIRYRRAVWAAPRHTRIVVVTGLLLATGAVTFVVQRHYFHRRYVTGYEGNPGLGVIYRWAQGVVRTRIALYGTVEQYPLYGAHDTNRVDYLGERTNDGGFQPISTCQTWRTQLNRGGYRYVVLTPAPTTAVPVTWTQADSAAHLVLRPNPEDYVFEVTGKFNPSHCS